MKAMLAVMAFAAFACVGTTIAEAAAPCIEMCRKGCLQRYPGGGGATSQCTDRCVTLKCNR
jgi:hypothetical protein